MTEERKKDGALEALSDLYAKCGMALSKDTAKQEIEARRRVREQAHRKTFER